MSEWHVRAAPAPPPLPPSDGPTLGLVILVSVLVSVIVAGGILLVFGQRAEEPGVVVLPDLRGATVVVARKAAYEAGTLLHVVGDAPAGALDEERVVAQQPLPGSLVRAGERVEVRVVEAAKPVAPAVSVATTPIPPPPPEPVEEPAAPADGAVDEPEPAAVVGDDAAPAAVDEAPEAVAVPSTAQLSRADAEARLERAGFRVRVYEVFHPSVTRGHVIKTEPRAGEVAAAGSLVKVWVTE